MERGVGGRGARQNGVIPNKRTPSAFCWTGQMDGPAPDEGNRPTFSTHRQTARLAGQQSPKCLGNALAAAVNQRLNDWLKNREFFTVEQRAIGEKRKHSMTSHFQKSTSAEERSSRSLRSADIPVCFVLLQARHEIGFSHNNKWSSGPSGASERPLVRERLRDEK